MGYVYLMCDAVSDTFKIGVTKRKNIEERLKDLQTGNAADIFIRSYYECEYPYRLEKLLHNHFANKRVRGEWFALDAKDICSFKETCSRLYNIVESIKENPFINLI